MRVFREDVLVCPCGGRRVVLAFITEKKVVREILEHLGLACASRRLRVIIDELGAETPELVAHRTSAGGAASVSRHTADLDADALAAAEELFGPALDAFGYPRTRALASA